MELPSTESSTRSRIKPRTRFRTRSITGLNARSYTKRSIKSSLDNSINNIAIPNIPLKSIDLKIDNDDDNKLSGQMAPIRGS